MHMYMHTLFLQREVKTDRKGEGGERGIEGEEVTHTMYTYICMLCTLVYMMYEHGIVTWTFTLYIVVQTLYHTRKKSLVKHVFSFGSV